MAIKYVEVRTQKWDTWLVKLDDRDFGTEDELQEAAYAAVENEIEFDEADYKMLSLDIFQRHYPSEGIENFYARHNGIDHVIDYTNP